MNHISSTQYGPWTQYHLPANKSDWHPLCRAFLDYWLEIAPPGRLPGRQHMSPTDIGPLLPRIWMLDIVRQPLLRFRYRLVGTAEVRTLGRETTGQWLDDVHPQLHTDPNLYGRFRFMAEQGQPTWRRGPVRWGHDTEHRIVENCMVPLAADGHTVDIILAFSVLYYQDGQPVAI